MLRLKGNKDETSYNQKGRQVHRKLEEAIMYFREPKPGSSDGKKLRDMKTKKYKLRLKTRKD